jgi:hypothetical protein
MFIMKIPRLRIALAGVGILAVMLACNALSRKPTVSNIRMTTDESGKTAASSYAPGDKFFVFADLGGLSVGSDVQAKWYAVDAHGVALNSLINTSDYKYESGITYVYFQLSTSDGGDWPTGTYRVQMYLDGIMVGEREFAVQ